MGHILDYFSGTPRPQQRAVLEQLQDKWHKYDVFVIQAPTATGKTKLAEAIAKWSGDSSIVVPNNVLLDQYIEDIPDIHFLKKRQGYQCITYPEQTCATTHKKLGRCCKGCSYVGAVRKAKAAKVGVYNYYTYLAHRLYRPTLIVDEAHLLVSTLQDLAAKKIWQHDYGWPDQVSTLGDILEWIEELPGLDKKLRKMRNEILSLKPSTLVYKTDEYHGTKKEWLPLIKLIPLDTRNESPLFWPPHKTRKTVLMSATINKPDIDNMGLGNYRVVYIEVDSPIPTERRPIIYTPVGNMSYRYQQENIPKVVNTIKELLARHKMKGMIHAPYSMIQKMRTLLTDDRLVWHDRDNKQQRYHEFIESPPEHNRVMMASGMYEGVDLAYDKGGWQVLCKVPYPSLVDPAIKAKLEEEPAWYQWQAARVVLQASGRICRTPTDYGITYILDSSFTRLYREHTYLFPRWWQQAYELTYK